MITKFDLPWQYHIIITQNNSRKKTQKKTKLLIGDAWSVIVPIQLNQEAEQDTN